MPRLRHASRRMGSGARASRRALGGWARGTLRTGGFYGRYSGSGAEKKFLDLDVNDAVVATGGLVFNSINLIPQGTTESTRIGRKCTLTKVGWKMDIKLPGTTLNANTTDVVRVMMFLDKQCNGATATVTGVLESADYQSFNNLSNSSRFRTLMDRTYTVTANSGGGDGTSNDFGEGLVTDTFYMNLNVPIEFDSTAGAITEIRSNNIGILVISKFGLAAFSSKVRVRFSDA